MTNEERIEAYLQSILTSVQDVQRRMALLKAAGVKPPADLADRLQNADRELGDARDHAYEADV